MADTDVLTPTETIAMGNEMSGYAPDPFQADSYGSFIGPVEGTTPAIKEEMKVAAPMLTKQVAVNMETLKPVLVAKPVYLDPRLAAKFLQQAPGQRGGITSAERSYLTTTIPLSYLSNEEKLVYGAIADGYSTTDDIQQVTGLDKVQVNKALSDLNKKGKIQAVGTVSI